jgi:16S rRNA (adenine1518-N6/adenine1519-N6)-dimethyltransferase
MPERTGGRSPDRAALERLDPLAIRRLLRGHGLRARRSLSQNFLADPDVLAAILAEAGARPGDGILEIGPGFGILTGALLGAGAAVTAVELDVGLAALLRDRFGDAVVEGGGRVPQPGELRLIEGDALDQDLTGLVPPPYHVVANLPYHITSPILHRLLGRAPRPERMVLMVQWEVAERLAAPPGRMSYLSVFVQYHAEVRISRRVPAAAFEPAPAVDSAIIVAEPCQPGSRVPDDDPAVAASEDELWALVQAGFRERRKMLHNVLVRQLGLPAARIDAGLESVGINRDRRPQTLSVDEWLALRAALDGGLPPHRTPDVVGPPSPPGPTGPQDQPGQPGQAGPAGRPDASRRSDAAGTDRAARRLAPVIRLAPAKLNLTLAVLGRRADGYHELHSVMVPLALADVLSIAPAAGPADSLRVDGLDAGRLEDNLVLRAIAVTRAAVLGTFGRAAAPFPLAARLEKRIPVAAGLGGGSSDAAAAIDAALEAWGLAAPGAAGVPGALDSSRDGPAALAVLRASVAGRVGSDVPFFLAGGPALVEGRGERVQALGVVRGVAPGVLLVTPAVPAPTPAVFAAFDAGGAAAPADPHSTRRTSEHLAAELRAGLDGRSLVARAGVLAGANDLAAAAGTVVAGLTGLRRALVRLLGRPVGVSGSGPSLWVLYPSAGAADVAADRVRTAVADGSIVAPGAGPPSIVATSIVGAAPAALTSPSTNGPPEERT